MKNFLILCLIVLISLPALSQPAPAPSPEIRVVGNSKLEVAPDVGTLTIMIKTLSMESGKAIDDLNSKTTDITKQLASLGFKESEVKTTNFNVSVNRVYRNNRTLDSGFVARQNVKVEFQNTKQMLKKILDKFSGSKTDFEFSFDFKLSDKLMEKTRNDLIRQAIKDASDKASLIADASHVKLKKVKQILYGQTAYTGGPLPMRVEAFARSSDSQMGFVAEDLQYSDTVTIAWEIE